MAQLVSIRYAAALFELAVELEMVNKFEEEITLVYNGFKDNDDFIKIINHPIFSNEEKLKVITDIFDGSISQEIIGFLSVLFTKNRQVHTLEILEEFIAQVENYKGIKTAYVKSAVELSEQQIKDLKEKISQKINKQVNIEVAIDKSLIGGISINVDGLFIDNSVRSQLKDIKKKLISRKLA